MHATALSTHRGSVKGREGGRDGSNNSPVPSTHIIAVPRRSSLSTATPGAGGPQDCVARGALHTAPRVGVCRAAPGATLHGAGSTRLPRALRGPLVQRGMGVTGIALEAEWQRLAWHRRSAKYKVRPLFCGAAEVAELEANEPARKGMQGAVQCDLAKRATGMRRKWKGKGTEGGRGLSANGSHVKSGIPSSVTVPLCVVGVAEGRPGGRGRHAMKAGRALCSAYRCTVQRRKKHTPPSRWALRPPRLRWHSFSQTVSQGGGTGWGPCGQIPVHALGGLFRRAGPEGWSHCLRDGRWTDDTDLLGVARARPPPPGAAACAGP